MVLDARGIEISLNEHVRYVDTGTIGQVVDKKTIDDVGWVRIDKTGLWYLSNHTELLDEKDIKKSSWGAGKELDVDERSRLGIFLSIFPLPPSPKTPSFPSTA